MTLGAFERVKLKCSIDLMAPHEGTPTLSTRIFNDLYTQGAILCGLIMPKLEAANLTIDAFKERLSPKVAADAVRALHEGLIDFFQQIGRPEIVQALRKEEELRKATLEKVSLQVQSISVASLSDNIAEKVRAEMSTAMSAATSGTTSGSLPESSASIPAP